MKRLLCVFLMIMLIATSASAVTDLDIMVEGHNMNCSICSAQKIEGNPKIDAEYGAAQFDLTAKLHDVFFYKDGKVTGFGCVCKDPEYEIEFLAQCITACYNFSGMDAGKYCYDVILSQFMFARSGNPLGATTAIPGIAVQLDKESFGYVFTLTVVNK